MRESEKNRKIKMKNKKKMLKFECMSSDDQQTNI